MVFIAVYTCIYQYLLTAYVNIFIYSLTAVKFESFKELVDQNSKKSCKAK